MDDCSSHDAKRKRLFWGMVLTWAVSLPLVVGIFNSFRGISEQKATGLGAVAGGVAGAYVIFGVILGFILPVAAIVLLARSFSVGHRLRSFVSVFHIGLSALSLALAGLLAWMSFIYLPHAVH
jgi:hypothetical protein